MPLARSHGARNAVNSHPGHLTPGLARAGTPEPTPIPGNTSGLLSWRRSWSGSEISAVLYAGLSATALALSWTVPPRTPVQQAASSRAGRSSAAIICPEPLSTLLRRASRRRHGAAASATNGRHADKQRRGPAGSERQRRGLEGQSAAPCQGHARADSGGALSPISPYFATPWLTCDNTLLLASCAPEIQRCTYHTRGSVASSPDFVTYCARRCLNVLSSLAAHGPGNTWSCGLDLA